MLLDCVNDLFLAVTLLHADASLVLFFGERSVQERFFRRYFTVIIATQCNDQKTIFIVTGVTT